MVAVASGSDGVWRIVGYYFEYARPFLFEAKNILSLAEESEHNEFDSGQTRAVYISVPAATGEE